jgi:lysophospholipase L1-like esterase
VPTSRLVIIGSSLAAGWVTSLEERHDFQNGFAQRLARLLGERNVEVIISAQPGDSTADVLKRLDRDLLVHRPDMALVTLSLGNEGLIEAPEKAVEKYKKGMLEIVSALKNAGIRPILGSCYASNRLNSDHYRILQETNLWLSSLGLPLVNLLGALDDGRGHFPPDLIFDHSHPMNRGHEELFTAIPPGFFLSPPTKTVLPDLLPAYGVILPPRGLGKALVSYIPGDPMHSFALAFSFKTQKDTPLASIQSQPLPLELAISQGRLAYRSGAQTLLSGGMVSDGNWHTVILSHHHLPGETTLVLDGIPVGSVPESHIPRQFLLAPKGARGLSVRNLLVYRAALSALEASHLSQGKLFRGSLEVFAPLDEALKARQTVKNLSGTGAILFSQIRNFKKDLAALEEKIARSETRRLLEKTFPARTAIHLPPGNEAAYTGTYEIKPGDQVTIEWTDETFWMVDHDQRQDIYPETPACFFIRHPLMNIEIRFSQPQNDRFTRLGIYINGQPRMKARWLDPLAVKKAETPPPPKKTKKRKKNTEKKEDTD